MKNIRIIYAVLPVLFSGITTMSAQNIKGSDTVLPLTQRLAEEYMKEYPERRVTVTGGGSGVGISALIEGTADIAMSSRAIKPEEEERLRQANRKPVDAIIAYDALAIVVNPDNPVDKLTRRQLEEIFRGKVTDWAQLGGKNLKIVVYTRETSSGTYEFFRQHVLERRNFTNRALSMPATGAIIQSVGQTSGAIGYVGLPYIGKLKPIAVSYDGGKNYYLPTPANAADGKYPIVRPLYYYYLKSETEKVKPFLDFVFSPKGQEITRQLGYVPITEETRSE